MDKLLVFLLSSAVFGGYLVSSKPYDYSASIECLADPPKPQYGGGIIRNPEFNNGTETWKPFGRSSVAVRKSESGNRFSVTRRRTSPHQSISQKVFLQKAMLYAFSAWVQVDRGNAAVRVVFKTSRGFIHAGEAEAKSGCWSMIKGGLTPKSSGPAEIFFESENTGVEIWLDSVSLQPFTEHQWRAHQAKAIDKVRKKSVAVQAVDGDGKAVPGASVSIQHRRPSFPFGCAMASTILDHPAYQSWFASRFTVTTFENEMKWYATEAVPGKENYSAADAMLAFTKRHGIAVRGHNVFWDDAQTQMGWVKSLSARQLRNATQRRLDSVVSRYRGEVISWDVVNENMHFSFFEDELGADTSSIFYETTRKVDPNAMLFLNEFNTLEHASDFKVTPAKYLEKLQRIEANMNHASLLAIGLESHFGTPDLAYMRAALDTLARANRSIWLTEVDVHNGTEQARNLEGVLREGYSHPAVEGIVMWSAWHPGGCYRMCLTDNNFNNLPTGDVVDKLIAEWKSGDVTGETDADGFFRTRLFHGEYEISISRSSGKSSSVQSLKVADSPHQTTFKIRI